ncbi:MAG: 3' terminal RNA ribose 2'-O-methyltransferase Hen1 [Gemmataceae bacterium]
MLLTISTDHRPASDLGFLLHKHPDRFQSFELSFGKAHVYYPEVGADRCTACLMLDVDAVGMVRGKNPDQNFLLAQYVNDRPYAASSFMSVAIAQVLGSALQGRCKDRPELVATPLPLEARLDVLCVRGGEAVLRGMFEPLGYEVEAVRHPLDERFPEWGESPYYSVTVRNTVTLSELLTHLYVLIPVFDARKHYFVGDDEMEKLLAKGEGWLARHPLKDEIARRFLRFQPSLYRMALSRLVVEEEPVEGEDETPATERAEEKLETPLSLNEQRLMAVVAALRASGAKRVLDLGCGEGKLLRELLKDRQFEQILGMDVSVRTLEVAARRLKLDRLPDHQAGRVKVVHGSLMYRDKRLAGFDAASVVEVVEHLDPPRLTAFERVLFEFAKPRTVVLTTPNSEFNVTWESLPAGQFRHADHRFEWTRQEFQNWATGLAARFGYAVRFLPVGPEHPEYGSPTQMAIFHRDGGGDVTPWKP